MRRWLLVVVALLAGCSPRTGPAPTASSGPASATAGTAATAQARTMLALPRADGAWPGLNGLSGVNGDPNLDTASVHRFCTARGRPCPVAHTYTDRTSYVAMTSGTAWTFDRLSDFPGVLVVSQGLVPDGGDGEMTACASGEFDSLWRSFGTLMVEHDRADSIVRLGWEFNEPTMSWRGTDAATYISCFRHAATAIRATDPQVLIDWTINAHRTPGTLCGGVSTNCYPGDDFVDIVGIDNYDHYPWSPTKADFDRTATRAEGLTWLYDFARQHGKPFSVGEWGVVPTADAGRENPSYIRWMHEWFAAHAEHLAYEAYFSDCLSSGVQSSLFNPDAGCRSNPASADLYRSLYRE